VALFLSQTAMYGSNNMTLLCGDRGMVAVINLNEPELAGVEQIDLYIDGETVKLPDVEIISREDFRFQALSLLPMELLRRLTSAKEIGARASSPEAGIFFGFEGGVEDPKIAETAKGCLAQTRAAASPMQRLEGVDFTGGDLTQSGFRNISFSQCQQICLRNARCVAVSYVVSSQWCWPKGVIASTQRRSGIISAIRQ